MICLICEGIDIDIDIDINMWGVVSKFGGREGGRREGSYNVCIYIIITTTIII